MKLRENQIEPVAIGVEFLRTPKMKPSIIVAPTAFGKSIVIAAIAKELGVVDKILKAPPTDGLWDDSRTDEDQLGASYEELEKAMKQVKDKVKIETLSSREIEVYKILNQFKSVNKHKMEPIPVCIIPEKFKTK